MTPATREIFTLPMYDYPDKRAFGRISPVQVNDLASYFCKSNCHLEIAVPYARARHGYQDAFVVTGKDTGSISQYLLALRAQAEQLNLNAVTWDSLSFAGSPLYLNMVQLKKLFEIAPDILGFKPWKNYMAMASSPRDVTEEKMDFLIYKNLNRLALNIFSFCQRELDDLKRPHTVEEAVRGLSLAKEAALDTLAVEIVYGLPSQTLESFMITLEKTAIAEPDEIILQPLYYLEGKYLTDMAEYVDIRYDLYNFASEYLIHEGYTQLSMRRFVKNARVAIGKGADFGDNVLSLGCGGCSVIGNILLALPVSNVPEDSVRAVERYIIQQKKGIMDHGYVLSREELKRRYVIQKLIHGGRVEESAYKALFDSHILLDFPEFNDWSRQYYVERKNGMLTLTPLGLSLSDYLGSILISVDVYKKIIRWDEKYRPRM